MKTTLRRALALWMIALVALSGFCAQAATGSGSGSFVGFATEAAEPLERGDRGEAVEQLQARLIELGYLDGEADGAFGAKTEAAVRAFQVAANLEETGIADAETQDALNAPNAPQATEVPESMQKPPQAASKSDSEMVWIPRTGKRYHNNKNCSGMKNPKHVTIEEAVRLGFTPCKKCYN